MLTTEPHHRDTCLPQPAHLSPRTLPQATLPHYRYTSLHGEIAPARVAIEELIPRVDIPLAMHPAVAARPIQLLHRPPSTSTSTPTSTSTSAASGPPSSLHVCPALPLQFLRGRLAILLRLPQTRHGSP